MANHPYHDPIILFSFSFLCISLLVILFPVLFYFIIKRDLDVIHETLDSFHEEDVNVINSFMIDVIAHFLDFCFIFLNYFKIDESTTQQMTSPCPAPPFSWDYVVVIWYGGSRWSQDMSKPASLPLLNAKQRGSSFFAFCSLLLYFFYFNPLIQIHISILYQHLLNFYKLLNNFLG